MKENITFDLTAERLQSLMECRGIDAVDLLNTQFGGVKGLLELLKVKPNEGINDSEVAERAHTFGINEIPAKSPKSIFILMWEALQDVTLIILIVAALVSLGLSLYAMYMDKSHSEEAGWIESLAIMVAVIVVVLVVSFNDWQKERQFRGLQQKVEAETRVHLLRQGEIVSLHQYNIVVGDICMIKYGDVIPADGIIVQSSDLKIDESSLTGESDHVKKGTNRDPILLSGSRIMEGSGRMVVTAVGSFSQAGIIFGLLQNSPDEEVEDNESVSKQSNASKRPGGSSKEKSILQNKLTILAIQIGYAGTYVALVTVLILTLSYVSLTFIQKKLSWETARDIQVFVKFFIIGVTVLVVAVPEGLPLAVTIALAYSVKKMMNDNNLVRHLDACETMGNATSICSDKTGTLTTNRMTAVKYYLMGNLYTSVDDIESVRQKLLYQLTVGIVVNCSYTSKLVPPKVAGGLMEQLGNKTECALLGFVSSLSEDVETIRKSYPEENLFKVYTFNSERKSMSTILENSEAYHLFTKGASELIIKRCKWMVASNGSLLPLTEELKLRLIVDIVESMADEGLRTIGLAYRFIPKGKTSNVQEVSAANIDFNDENDVHDYLILYAIIGIEDPVRPEVPEAIIQCQNAGIIVRMVTGDNISTARSIAYKCGIIKEGDGYDVLDSAEFNKRIRDPITNAVKQEKLDLVFPNLRVLARSSPQDKYNLVNGIINSFQYNNREIVAVTGDGTNDGPALKKADVGFAMGIAGTDVAKEASDIILTDDNFNSIVKAVMWGRNVYDSITKFLQFQLTVNIVAIIIAFIGACFVSDSPLKAIQMLWVNLIMDTLASLALATEMPTEELLRRAPYGRTASLINKTMIKNIIGHAIYQLIVIIGLLFYGDILLNIDNGQVLLLQNDKDPNKHFTVIFNTFVLMTLFNEFNARKIHGQRNVFSGLHHNPLFIIIWLVTMAGQILIVEFGNKALSTKGLNLNEWLWCLAFGIGELLWGQFIISIPDSILPEINMNKKLRPEATEPELYAADHKEGPQLVGQILWLKGLTRIQSQLQVIEAFRFGLEDRYETLNHNYNNLRLRRRIMVCSNNTKRSLLDSGDTYRIKYHL